MGRPFRSGLALLLLLGVSSCTARIMGSAFPDGGMLSPPDGGSAGGPPDGGASADGGTTAASLCADAGFWICDGFEGATLDPVWTTQLVNGTITFDTARVYRGRQSAHFHTGAAVNDTAQLVETRTFPAPNDTIFGRAFVYLASPAPTASHATLFMGLNTTAPAGGGWWMYSYAGMNDKVLFVYYNGGTGTDASKSSNEAFPVDRWVCMEFEFNGTTSEAHFWQDGTELPEIAVSPSDSWPAPPFQELDVGWNLVSAPDPAGKFDLWIDEMAVDGARIGCDR